MPSRCLGGWSSMRRKFCTEGRWTCSYVSTVRAWECLVFRGKVLEGAQSDDQSEAKLQSSGPYTGSTVHFFEPWHELQQLRCTLVHSAAFLQQPAVNGAPVLLDLANVQEFSINPITNQLPLRTRRREVEEKRLDAAVATLLSELDDIL